MAEDNFSSEMKTTMEKFDGKKNFSLWQVRMRDFLVQQGTDEALDGKENKPAGMSDKAWTKMNSKACSTIRSSVTDNVVYDIVEETSAKEMWKKLEVLYMGKNLTNRLLLKQELYSLKRREGADLQGHVGEFNKLLCDLSNVGVKLEDEDKAIILLTSVKSTHQHLFNTLLYGRDTITVEQVKQALFSSEKMEKQGGASHQGEAEAFVAHSQKKKGYGKPYQSKAKEGSDAQEHRLPMKDATCHYCGEKGHYIRHCPIRRAKEAEGKGKAVAGVVTSEAVDVCNQEPEGEVLVIAEQKAEKEEWVMDSAGCFHVCPHRDWFVSYRPMEGKVFMGNDSQDRVEGIGSIRFRTSNGLIRLLTDVRHVPTMKRNVISLGMLEQKGFSFDADRGLLRVKKGYNIKLIGKRVGTMYHLLGEVLVRGEVAGIPKVKEAAVALARPTGANQGEGCSKMVYEWRPRFGGGSDPRPDLGFMLSPSDGHEV